MNVVLVDLVGVLGELIEKLLSSDPDVHVTHTTATDALTLAQAGAIDALIGQWAPEAGESIAQEILRLDPRLVLLVASGGREYFDVYTRRGRETLSVDIPAASFVSELRRRHSSTLPDS